MPTHPCSDACRLKETEDLLAASQQSLLASQAREAKLRKVLGECTPELCSVGEYVIAKDTKYDDSALQEALADAKRDALEDAREYFNHYFGRFAPPIAEELRRMAQEIKP